MTWKPGPTVDGAREQHELAIAFNEMTDRLAPVLEAQREFVGNASHQLRTPLTGLRLRLEAAGLKTDDPAVRHELELAEAEVERLTRLLNSLLTLAREATGRRCARRSAPRRVRVGARALAAPRRGERAPAGARRRRRRVRPRGREDVAITLDNLIENALDYAPAGTTVTLTWDRERPPGRARRGSGSAARRGAPRLRALPSRAATDRPGTGLGLAIVEALARRWGGSASISTRDDGAGSRAEVVLPLAVTS